jgi:hypothetical protein
MEMLARPPGSKGRNMILAVLELGSESLELESSSSELRSESVSTIEAPVYDSAASAMLAA